ncbi:hypothetical protein FB639_001529 [Coemansia asiatica]|nr:hypothetical protein FB639_001529 [Coemansia asiatica]
MAFGGFGSSATSGTGTGGSFFGNASTSAAPASSGLFGNSSTQAVPASTGLFGSNSTSAAPASTSLFGSSSMSAAPASSSLFGSNSTSAAPASMSIFGLSNTSAPTASTAPSAFTGANTASATGATLTRKTKFVDLPADIQNMLTEIERQKQVQIQIGSSIIADETEKEMLTVTKAIQQLRQELEVVKMTLRSDRDLVDESKAQVSFAVKHAEKAASLVAHATDDGSWAQSGLTPLQVANRQKTLLALQNNSGEVGQMLEFKDIVDLKPTDNNKGGVVDPYEAVRRIQFASMHYDVASEYYWAWMARAEGQAGCLAERLDQLERHVSGALASCDDIKGSGNKAPGQVGGGRASPKAVADVMQYQNDSFLAIAGKVAALDDDVKRLQKQLGIKSKSKSKGYDQA